MQSNKSTPMKVLTAIILIMILSFAACLVLPWWSIALCSVITVLFIPLKPLYSFLAGFSSLFLLWLILSWWISSSNNHILAHRVSLLILKTDSPFLLIIFTAFIGGIVAGLAALSASFLRQGVSIRRNSQAFSSE